jgi:hypothetical protein
LLALLPSQSPKLAFELIEVVIAGVLEVDETIPRAFEGAEQFIEFDVDSFGVAVLGILQHEKHQERPNGRRRVDYQLPGIRISEVGPGGSPQDHQNGRCDKGSG